MDRIPPFLENYQDLAKTAFDKINKTENMPIVLISLGLPKQEMVALSMGKELDLSETLFIPLGAAIDFRTGTATRSSKILETFRLGVASKTDKRTKNV